MGLILGCNLCYRTFQRDFIKTVSHLELKGEVEAEIGKKGILGDIFLLQEALSKAERQE